MSSKVYVRVSQNLKTKSAMKTAPVRRSIASVRGLMLLEMPHFQIEIWQNAWYYWEALQNICRRIWQTHPSKLWLFFCFSLEYLAKILPMNLV